ncbi:MAG: family 20 glycosylhydrolase [Oscillospiraceae bacterium]|nr:family 20 glycosylhydrolase [Oscillospiraceae bacterium]
MKIGSILNEKCNINYYRMGTNLPLCATDGVFAWNSFLLSGIDIEIKLDRKYFADTVFFTLAGAAARVDVLYFDGEEYVLGGRLSGEVNYSGAISVPVSVPTDALIVRLYGCLEDIKVEDLSVTGGEFSNAVYPIPKNRTDLGGDALLSEYICVTDGSADACFAKEYYEDLIETTLSGERKIEFLTDTSLGEEEYRILSNAEGCRVFASSRRGFCYAAATLAQLSCDGRLLFAEICDEPMCTLRGYHMGIPARNKFPLTKRLIKYLLVPMKYNMIIFEIAGAMRYHRHPELNEMWETIKQKTASGEWPNFPHHIVMCGNGDTLEQEEVRELIAFAESYGLEVVPEVQSLSHVQYLTKAHPEIAEIAEEKVQAETVQDLRLADIPTNDFYPDSYCPSNEKSYELLFDVLDEVIEVFRPKRFVHMGHDELYTHNVCPICKKKTVAEIFASDVNRIHEHLKGKGLRMMIWGDMLNTVNAYAAPDAIDAIPKDILLLDFIWYFDMEHDTEDRLLEHGFEVAVGNLYSSHFPRFESRIRKAGVLGGQVSTWVETDEKSLSLEGKFFDALFTANLLWSETYDSRAFATYAEYLTHIIPQIRSRVFYPNGAPSCHGTHLPLAFKESLPKSVKAMVPQGNVTLAGVTFDVSGARDFVTIAAGCKAKSLVLLAAAANPVMRVAWGDMLELARVTVRYTDGTAEEIPLEYGYNIYDIHTRYGLPLAGGYYRHEGFSGTFAVDAAYSGKAPDGSDVSLRSFEWENPYPEKEIAEISLSKNADAHASTYLFAVTAVV